MSEVNNSSRSAPTNWQDAIDPGLQERLMRPLEKPGVIDKNQLAGNILSRSERFANRLPLVSQLERRFSSIKNLPTGQVPIVYAQPLSSKSNVANTTMLGGSPASGGISRPIVQAKFAPASSKNASASPRAIAPAVANSQGSQPVLVPQKPNSIAPSTPKNAIASSTKQTSSPLPLGSNQNAENVSAQQQLNSITPSTSEKAITSTTEQQNSSLPVVPSQSVEPSVQQNLNFIAPSPPKNAIAAATEPANLPLPLGSNQNAENVSAQQQADAVIPSISPNAIATSADQVSSPLPIVPSQSIEPISDLQNLNFTSASTSKNTITNSVEQSTPLPVVRSQTAESISVPQKQQLTPSERLPIVYAEPFTGEVSNLDRSLTLANSQPLQTQVNQLPVVQARYSQSQQPTRSQHLTNNSSSPSNVSQTRENSSQETSNSQTRENSSQETNKTKSYIPTVRVTNAVRYWLEPQPHPLLNKQTAANSNPDQIFNTETPTVANNSGTPLIFSAPSSPSSWGQQADRSSFTSSQQSFDVAQGNYNPAAAIAIPSQQNSQNYYNQPPVIESAQAELNNPPNNNSQTKIDVDALADKVERKLMRRLVVENERRGQTRWR